MKKRKVTHRVKFNKVVKVNHGKSKLKRINATNLAYDVLNKGALDTETLKYLVEKHKQHGSTRKAIEESIKTLHKMDMRVCKPKYNITTFGALSVDNKNISCAMQCSDRLSDAKTILKSIYKKYQI
jgi:hypothetical protein